MVGVSDQEHDLYIVSWGLAAFAGLAIGLAPQQARSQEASPPPPAPPSFVEVPGLREFSGQLLVRPVQESAWISRGFSAAQANGASAAARRLLSRQALRVLPLTDIHVVALAPGETEAARCAELMSTGLYEFAEPDWIVYPARGPGETRPDDPSQLAQWQNTRIKATNAWNGFTGDGSITCAFVDTGVDLTHPDLAPMLVPGFNSVTNLTQGAGGQVSDVNGHGTSVAGAAAAMGNNFSGGSGVCWTARIMPIRATNYASGSAFMSNILYGASWAAFNGAKVVSVSYAGIESPSVEPTGQVIMQSYGGLLIWAAGNTSSNLSGFDYPSITIVGSTDVNDALAWDTSYGRAIDVMAPGVNVYIPTLGGGYAFKSGTSFAAPIAAGVLALAWSAAPTMTPAQAMTALYQSCNPLEVVSEFNNTGWGRVNAQGAVELARGTPVPWDLECCTR